MAIKFPLEMKDGVLVRNITDLKENFDVEKVVGYFLDGKLKSWLEARYYEEEAEAIEKLESDDSALAKKLCEIFEVEYQCNKEINQEELVRRNERMTKLKQFTDDSEILESIDDVVFNQEELAELYDKGKKKIYLCEGEFFIPKSKQNLEYILVGEPVVDGLIKNDSESSNSEKQEKGVEQTCYSKNKKSGSDYIFEKLADIICWDDYVIADDYIVFTNSQPYCFEDNLPSLDVDENYSEEHGDFRVWDINREKLSSFKLTGYDDYKELIAATGNKIVLKNSGYGNDVAVYDIENKKIKLTCENWCGTKMGISVCNGKIAYIDKNHNLYYIALDSYERVFVESLDSVHNKILLSETSLIYVKEDKIFQYEFIEKRIKLIKNLGVSVEELMSQDDRLYIIHVERNFGSGNDKLIILEMDLKDSEKNLKKVFKTEMSSWKVVRKDPYYILLKEELGYPVYAFNANLGTVKKILSECGYTTSKTHWLKSTDYFHYGYRFCVVGNYFFYDTSQLFYNPANYYRLNMITGEQLRWKKTDN